MGSGPKPPACSGDIGNRQRIANPLGRGTGEADGRFSRPAPERPSALQPVPQAQPNTNPINLLPIQILKELAPKTVLDALVPSPNLEPGRAPGYLSSSQLLSRS